MSFEVSLYIQDKLTQYFDGIEASVLNLSDYPYLLDHYGEHKNDEEKLASEKESVLKQMYACDAVVVVAPEWGGMLPPALVNLLLLSANGSAGGLPFGHKPAFAVGVSASGGGSNPITQLKGYTAKNSHLVWLPLHVVIQNVETFLTIQWQPGEGDRYMQIQSRLLVGLNSLVIYARQLVGVREELVALSKVHPFGQ